MHLIFDECDAKDIVFRLRYLDKGLTIDRALDLGEINYLVIRLPKLGIITDDPPFFLNCTYTRFYN